MKTLLLCISIALVGLSSCATSSRVLRRYEIGENTCRLDYILIPYDTSTVDGSTARYYLSGRLVFIVDSGRPAILSPYYFIALSQTFNEKQIR